MGEQIGTTIRLTSTFEEVFKSKAPNETLLDCMLKYFQLVEADRLFGTITLDSAGDRTKTVYGDGLHGIFLLNKVLLNTFCATNLKV